jgi:hypothetical protein
MAWRLALGECRQRDDGDAGLLDSRGGEGFVVSRDTGLS